MVRVAESLCLVFDRQRGSHAVYYSASDNHGVAIPMHGSADLKPGTLGGLINDMGLTIDEFAARV